MSHLHMDSRSTILPTVGGDCRVTVCEHCECVIMDTIKHLQVCPAAHMTILAVAEERETDEEPWVQPPFSLILTGRDGTSFIFDGSEDDTRISLTSLDRVDRAALRELLQQAFDDITPKRPYASGGIVTMNPQLQSASIPTIPLH